MQRTEPARASGLPGPAHDPESVHQIHSHWWGARVSSTQVAIS
jgi:hypothetical protein